MLTSGAREFYYRTVSRWAPNSEHEQYFYARMLEQTFRPGMTWLDAGCGHSLIPHWLKNADAIERRFLSESKLVVGCDVDLRSLQRPGPIRRIGCDLESLAFLDSSFDLITSNMVIEHLDHPDCVFREFFRVLKPSGTAVILTPNLYHWANLVSALTPYRLHTLLLKTLWDSEEEDVFPTKYHCNTARALRVALGACGFVQVAVHTVVGRPRLRGFGPLLYVECLVNRLIQKFPLVHEVLCAVATKPAPSADLRPLQSLPFQ